MRTKKTKEEFIAKMKDRIEARNIILDFVENVYFPMMALKFDGKVYNKRFINALNVEAEKISDLMSVSEGYDCITVKYRLDRYNYNDYEEIYLKLVCNYDGRINFDKTVNDEVGKKWIDGFKNNINDYQKSIDNYDDYCKKFEELEEVLKAYNSLPQPFRGNVDTSWLRIY